MLYETVRSASPKKEAKAEAKSPKTVKAEGAV